MQTSRNFGWALAVFMAALVTSSSAAAADTTDEPTSADRAILEQAGNAMVFQTVFADMVMALSEDNGVLEMAHYIYDLSHRGLKSIETMARDCGFAIDARMDATAWRRVGAMREISTPALRDQVYLDGQLMRLYEARQENLSATVHAKHDIVKGFALRSEPEIEDLILKVRAVAHSVPTSDHP